MRNKHSLLQAFVWMCGLILLPPVLAAQPATQPGTGADPEELLKQAMQHYTRASGPVGRNVWAAEYLASIRDLTEFLQKSPEDGPALFLRALAHGQLAARHEEEARVRRSRDEAQAAQQEQASAIEHYRAMGTDIDALLARQSPEHQASIALVEGVARVKLAGYADGAYAERVAARAKLLEQAEAAFRRYLHPSPSNQLPAPAGFERLRAEYFLAVVIYREALQPMEAPGTPDRLVHPARLEQAADMMLGLITSESSSYIGELVPADAPRRDEVIRRWQSYANLYLGLIRTRQGSQCASCGSLSYYSDAKDFFEQAWKLDTGGDYPQGEGSPGSYVPAVVEKHVPALEKALEGGCGLTEDFYIDAAAGFTYDTNVILLGHDTSPPPEIGRRRDVRFETGVALGYTLDLGKISPALDRWTVGVQGKAASNWHGDIHQFNEQNYGGSIALQYRMLDTWSAGDVTHGPLYAGVQYDYDYFLLGNNGFVRENRVSPRLALYTFDQHSVTTLSFRYEDRNYLEALSSNVFDRDGNYFALGLSQGVELVDMTQFYKNVGWEPWGHANDPVAPAEFDPSDPGQDTYGYQRWLRPYISTEYGWDSTRGQEFDTNRSILTAGITVPLPYGIDFDFSGNWEWQNYRERSSVDYHHHHRRDFVQRYNFGLERQFVLVPGDRANRRTIKMDRVTMSVRAGIQLIDDDSNVEDRLGQEVFSYDRALYGLSVAFQFN